jgi:sec-independent protein translocase protein TatA
MGIDMDGAFAPWHIIVLVVVLVLLFGSRRLPGAAKSLGESMHIFRRSVQGGDADDASRGGDFTASTTLPPWATPPAVTPPGPEATQQQLQDLQRQVADLQRQSDGPARSEDQTAQPR